MMHVDARERNFIVGTTILLLIFGTAVLVSSFAFGFQVPAPIERIDPRIVATPGQSPWAIRLKSEYGNWLLTSMKRTFVPGLELSAKSDSDSRWVYDNLLSDQQRCSTRLSAR